MAPKTMHYVGSTMNHKGREEIWRMGSIRTHKMEGVSKSVHFLSEFEQIIRGNKLIFKIQVDMKNLTLSGIEVCTSSNYTMREAAKLYKLATFRVRNHMDSLEQTPDETVVPVTVVTSTFLCGLDVVVSYENELVMELILSPSGYYLPLTVRGISAQADHSDTPTA